MTDPCGPASGCRRAKYNQPMPRATGRHDLLIALLDEGLRMIAAKPRAARPSPATTLADTSLSPAEKRASAALMRVNHAGEIAAQALYSGQAIAARSKATRAALLLAAAEERDHLAWCEARIAELDGRTSLLSPFWFGASCAIGCLAGVTGDRTSLGFVVETERQVEAHINDHLARLPAEDARSRAILEQMARDEAHHGTTAMLAGGRELPLPLKLLMRAGGGFLRRVALRV
jgi:3-demethoxyubiquinol 3-hydroxylase